MALTVKIRGDASQFEKTMRGVKSSVGGLSSKIGAIGAAAAGAAAGYFTLSKAMEFLQSSSAKAAGMEDLTNQMGLLSGSTEKARQMIKIFRDEAAKSPLSSEDYAKAAKTLMAFGMSADESLPIMRSLADISMGNSERFESLALAFAQTTAAGRLMGQEVLQFVNAGFNPLQQISLKTGESMATLKKRMEDGGISAQEVTQAFIAATSAGGKFYKAIELGANTTSAKIAQTKDNVDKLQIAFGTGFNEGLKDALDATNKVLPQLETRFREAGEFMGAAITESLTGNTKKFELIGQLIGEMVMAGIEAAVILSLDKLGARLGGGLANMIEVDKYSAIGVLDKISGGKIAEGIRSGTSSATSFGEQFRGAMQSTGVQSTLQQIEIQRQISEGVKTGINTSMSREVREGVLEAWSRQSQQATFSN